VGRTYLIAAGKVVLLFVVAVALQTLLISRISILGVVADLFIIFTVCIAIGRGPLEGAIFGFCAGIVADIAFFQPLGIHALIYTLAGYFVGMFVMRFGVATPWTVLLLTGVSSFAAQFVFGLFQYVIGPRAAFFTVVAVQMIPEMVVDALVAVPVFILLVRLRIIPSLSSQSSQTRSTVE
jgi:rod shape-determining protein MreD